MPAFPRTINHHGLLLSASFQRFPSGHLILGYTNSKIGTIRRIVSSKHPSEEERDYIITDINMALNQFFADFVLTLDCAIKTKLTGIESTPILSEEAPQPHEYDKLTNFPPSFSYHNMLYERSFITTPAKDHYLCYRNTTCKTGDIKLRIRDFNVPEQYLDTVMAAMYVKISEDMTNIVMGHLSHTVLPLFTLKDVDDDVSKLERTLRKDLNGIRTSGLII